MHWRRGGRNKPHARLLDDPVIVTVTRSLNLQAALLVAAEVDRLSARGPVVIDLTAIPGFDTDGAELLLGLQDRVGADRVSIVGFRQATARLIGIEDAEAPPAAAVTTGWAVRRLRNLAVVQAADEATVNTDDLEPVLAEALSEEVAIVVVDLRHATTLTSAGLRSLTFASSSAALNGQELLVVNVGPEAAEVLRRSGLSATTYVAPEPPPAPED